MPHDRQTPDSGKLIAAGENAWQVYDSGREESHVLVHPPTSYRRAFGGEPIRLGIVEFRILLFLAERPYHAFTRRQIAEAVTATGLPITDEAIDGHIASLRDQLGILHDFVQSVPFVGFRYKA